MEPSTCKVENPSSEINPNEPYKGAKDQGSEKNR